MADHRIVYQQGNQVIKTVPWSNGRPAAVAASGTSYAILDLRYPEDSTERVIVARTAASVSSVSTTTTAVAGVGSSDRSAITVASATGIEVGDMLLLSTPGSQQLMEVRAINGLVVYFAGEVDGQYPSGSTVQGVGVSGTFPSDEAADEERLDAGGGPYAVDWIFAGITGVFRELIYVKRHANKPLITARDVELLDPQAVRSTGHRLELDDIIEQASRDFRVELLSRQIQPERFLGGEIARNCVAYRCAYLLRLAMGRDQDDAQTSHYHARWMGLLNNLTMGKPGADVAETDINDHAESGSSVTTRGVFGLS